MISFKINNVTYEAKEAKEGTKIVDFLNSKDEFIQPERCSKKEDGRKPVDDTTWSEKWGKCANYTVEGYYIFRSTSDGCFLAVYDNTVKSARFVSPGQVLHAGRSYKLEVKCCLMDEL